MIFFGNLGELASVNLFLTKFWHSFNLRIDCHQGVVFLDHLIDKDFLFLRKLLCLGVIMLFHPDLLG